jgi:putative FmdB family regulatory protein
MPIYEYRCPRGHTFELFQRMTDPAAEVCEVCGESPVTKVLYPAAIHFKGSGFYSTDYGRRNRRPGQKEGAEAGGEAGEKKPDKAEPKAGESKAAESKAAEA